MTSVNISYSRFRFLSVRLAAGCWCNHPESAGERVNHLRGLGCWRWNPISRLVVSFWLGWRLFTCLPYRCRRSLTSQQSPDRHATHAGVDYWRFKTTLTRFMRLRRWWYRRCSTAEKRSLFCLSRSKLLPPNIYGSFSSCNNKASTWLQSLCCVPNIKHKTSTFLVQFRPSFSICVVLPVTRSFAVGVGANTKTTRTQVNRVGRLSSSQMSCFISTMYVVEALMAVSLPLPPRSLHGSNLNILSTQTDLSVFEVGGNRFGIHRTVPSWMKLKKIK